MIKVAIIFLLSFVNTRTKKEIVLIVLGSIVESKDETIDNATAESVMQLITKSNGNPITAYLVR